MVDDRTFEAMKRWLGHGETDVDAMLRLGGITREAIVTMCHTLTDSPWRLRPKDWCLCGRHLKDHTISADDDEEIRCPNGATTFARRSGEMP